MVRLDVVTITYDFPPVKRTKLLSLLSSEFGLDESCCLGSKTRERSKTPNSKSFLILSVWTPSVPPDRTGKGTCLGLPAWASLHWRRESIYTATWPLVLILYLYTLSFVIVAYLGVPWLNGRNLWLAVYFICEDYSPASTRLADGN